MKIPEPLRRLYQLWMKFSHVLGLIMSSILLSIFWLIVFGLYGICMRIIIAIRPKPKTDSYWIDSVPSTPETLLRQF